ncbi:hypothetical protein FRC06_005509, partial [Ceratobasidium sp. 370]
MEPAATRIWTELIEQFTALQHFSVWCLPSANLLDFVNTDGLRHFEFRRPWTHTSKDETQAADVIKFLKRCPALRAITYHAAKPMEEIDALARERNIALAWKENHYIDGYMEDVAPRLPSHAAYVLENKCIPSLTPANDEASGTKGEHQRLRYEWVGSPNSFCQIGLVSLNLYVFNKLSK